MNQCYSAPLAMYGSRRASKPVQMLFQSLGKVGGTTIELCEDGMQVLSDKALPVEEWCMVALDLNVGDRERRINAWGKVSDMAHEVNGRMAARIHFADMDAGCRLVIRDWQSRGES